MAATNEMPVENCALSTNAACETPSTPSSTCGGRSKTAPGPH